jgi:predicted PhzF superfamily epimerase YddE/YHI9
LDFPVDVFHNLPISSEIENCFDKRPLEAYKGKTDYMLVYEAESDIRAIKPNMDAISVLQGRGVIITAKGENVDFVSRFFAPQSGIIEDPVTGSAHTTLIPYWSGKLHKTEMSAIQISERRGYLQCKFLGTRVEISGQAKLYLEGAIYIE